MRTEEYKGRTMTILDRTAGDEMPESVGLVARFAVLWNDGPLKREAHGLCAHDDPDELLQTCKLAIDIYDEEVK